MTPSVHLHAGAAFARGLEVARIEFYGNGKSAQEAVGLGAIALTRSYGEFSPTNPYSGKTWDGMLGAYAAYFLKWPLDSDPLIPLRKIDGTPYVEFSFAVPVPGTRHPDTGDPILYTGRADMIGEVQGLKFIVDEKTTSLLGASWSRQWDLRGQFIGYVWAAQQSGIDVCGSRIRGISILKSGYGTADAVMYAQQWKIDSWLRSLRYDVDRMVRLWVGSESRNSAASHAWPQAYDHACTAYGGCPFVELCSVEHPEEWAETNFREEVWNPLTKETGND
jgi:hypothetical protein